MCNLVYISYTTFSILTQTSFMLWCIKCLLARTWNFTQIIYQCYSLRILSMPFVDIGICFESGGMQSNIILRLILISWLFIACACISQTELDSLFYVASLLNTKILCTFVCVTSLQIASDEYFWTCTSSYDSCEMSFHWDSSWKFSLIHFTSFMH